MSYPFLKGILEAGKEALRYLVISFVAEAGILLVQAVQAGINPQTGAIAINWSVVEAVAFFSFLTVIGRAVDKFKFIYSKESNLSAVANGDDIPKDSKGVIPF